jgi:excisionase family DNA binding protein
MMRVMAEDKSHYEAAFHEDESRYRLVDKENMNSDESRDRHVDRMSVSEAAELLGVTQSAVRKRVQRGTIPWDKDSEGRIYVYVDLSEAGPDTVRDKSRVAAAGQSRDELLEAYRDQVEFLRRELERKDTLLMSLMQRVPELEPAQETRDAPETASPRSDRGTAPEGTQEPTERRSWLYRFFFGP